MGLNGGYQWVSYNCTDPQKLYESIVFRASHTIQELKIVTNDGKQYVTNVNDDEKYHDWSISVTEMYDDNWLQRCYTALPTKKILEKGIASITIIGNENVTNCIFMNDAGLGYQGLWVYFHELGYLATNSHKDALFLKNGHGYTYDMEYEVLQLVSFRDESCKGNEKYNRDLCTHQILHQVSKG